MAGPTGASAMKARLRTAASNPENQDRGAIFQRPASLVLAVADGVGGRSGGTEAAALAVRMVEERQLELTDAAACERLLREMDLAVAKDSVAGETTCALAVATGAAVYGASVGD